jgi:hypothetical protein
MQAFWCNALKLEIVAWKYQLSLLSLASLERQ